MANIDGKFTAEDITPEEKKDQSYEQEIGQALDYLKLNSKKHESGIVMTLGAGYLYHKIFIETIVTALPQLNDELLKGYDRLSGGILLKQFFLP